MKPHLFPSNQSQGQCAFTLTELLVVVAVIALLFTLRLSALDSAKDQTLRGQCAGNIHKLALTAAIIANDNGDRLPVNVGGAWAWDMSWNIGNTFTNYMPLQSMYCPASGFNYDDNIRLWSYLAGGIHVIGYAQTFQGTADVTATNYNTTLTPQRTTTTAPPIQTLPAPLASQRVLFADATMSAAGQLTPSQASTYNWTDQMGGYAKHHRTAHMDGRLPAGGNVAMLDGHIEWRNFSLMVPRSVNTGWPEFWW